jgi:hypothetical protein
MAKDTAGAELEKYARANGIYDFSGSFEDAAKFCDYRQDLAQSLILSTREAKGWKTPAEAAREFKLPEVPAPESLSSYQARAWYLSQEELIASRLDSSQPLEQVARQAVAIRNELRTTTRNSMADREMAEHLERIEVNLTWEQLYKDAILDKKMSPDKAYEYIITKSMRSRSAVDRCFKFIKNY